MFNQNQSCDLDVLNTVLPQMFKDLLYYFSFYVFLKNKIMVLRKKIHSWLWCECKWCHKQKVLKTITFHLDFSKIVISYKHDCIVKRRILYKYMYIFSHKNQTMFKPKNELNLQLWHSCANLKGRKTELQKRFGDIITKFLPAIVVIYLGY